ncbi:carbohydrate ABC transporter permease [Deinococcus apachensis]|uniref:carbohydrate ABC transporter permease n=1 Tax=Deinococcus apachensis TaxID=309886 RepID=UPI00037268F1|nr:sugar ABC transporter permease [Deinococcus apachensis]
MLTSTSRPAAGRPPRGRFPLALPYLLPAFLFIALLTFIPAAYTVYLSFTNTSLLQGGARFVGFENFARLFADQSIVLVLRNTFVFVAGSVLLQIGLGVGLALLLNLPYRGRVLVRTLILATWIIPEVVVGFTWQMILAGGEYGLLNAFLAKFGLGPVLWLGTPAVALFSLILVNVWRGTAFSVILQLAALQAIPDELYEAARIDGANGRQLFRFVTLPMITPTLLINLVNNTLGTFNVTALVFALTNGGPARGTEVLALTMYNAAFKQYDLGFAAAIAMVLFAINVALVVVYVRLFRNTSEGAL